MFGRKKGTPTPPPTAATATETLANSPVRDRGGLSLRKPQPARPQPQPRATQAPSRPATPAIPAAPRPPGGTPSAQGDGKVLRVGPAIALSGEIAACDKLIVEGRVSAGLNRCRHIEVTRTGRFSGTAEVESAEIIGRFDGELTARRVMVRASARMSGKIRYGEMTLEPGAQIHGELTPLEPDVLEEEPS